MSDRPGEPAVPGPEAAAAGSGAAHRPGGDVGGDGAGVSTPPGHDASEPGVGAAPAPGRDADDPGAGATPAPGRDADYDAVRSDGAVSEAVAEAFASELAEAHRKADANWDLYLRAEADLDNLRRRSKRHTEEALRHLRRDLLTRMLDVVDNLERALSHAEADPGAVVDGVEGTYRALCRVLAQEGVVAIDAQDAPFDAALHDAAAVVPAPGVEEETVVSIERTGYTLDGELLRPARVVVGKPTEAKRAGHGDPD